MASFKQGGGFQHGWNCAAQAQGTLAADPLAECFVPPVTVYRGDDEARDWLEQVEAQETQVAQAVEQMQALEWAEEAGERRSLLNQLFPMHRTRCQWPSQCCYVGVCYGAAGALDALVVDGKFKTRVPNHPAEGEKQ